MVKLWVGIGIGSVLGYAGCFLSWLWANKGFGSKSRPHPDNITLCAEDCPWEGEHRNGLVCSD